MEVDGGDVPTSSSSKDEDSGFDSGDGLTSSPTRIDQKVYEEREYQQFLFEKAKEQNVIVCLPTGCGKTFIAVKLILHYLPSTFETGRKIILIATTLPLVHQQGEYLREKVGNAFTNSESYVGIVTGEMKPEDWDGEKWKQILQKHTVFSMTDQILRVAVERGHIPWGDISLLILDECHNATKKHPMASLMSNYREAMEHGLIPGVDLPRVLGLSATLINTVRTDVKRIPEDIKTIERNLCSRAITHHNYEEVLRCATQADVDMIKYLPSREWSISSESNISYNLSEDLEQIIKKLNKMDRFLVIRPDLAQINAEAADGYKVFWKKETPIKEFVRDIIDIQEILKEMGPFCAELAVLHKRGFTQYRLQKERRRRQRSTSGKSGAELVLEWVAMELEKFQRQLQAFMYFTSPDDANHRFKANYYVSSKVNKLVDILKKFRPASDVNLEDHQFCGIIFCQRRISAQVLCYYLQDLSKQDEDFSFIRCCFALGVSGTNNKGEMQSAALNKQSETLDAFRKNKLNILIATKVLEEGLDVPNCNFICRMDQIQSYPSFIQSMGRARQKGAKFYALVSDETEAIETDKVQGFIDFSKSLSAALIENCDTPILENEDDISTNDLNRVVPPFQPNGVEGASITAGSATQIVYQYCETLNRDKLSILSPLAKWREHPTKQGKQYQVCVMLPPSSVVRFAEGGCYSNKTVAKKAAFLEVCKRLYEAGVLHKKTLLPVPRTLPSDLSDFFDNLDPHKGLKDINGRKIGSKNRTQWYKKKLPEEFVKHEAHRSYNLYVITFRLDHFLANEEVKSLLTFEDQNYQFGLLTCADLSTVPDFLLFSRDGNYRVHLQPIELSAEVDIDAVDQFQRLLFSDDPELLNLHHTVLQNSEGNEPNFIVPLKRTGNGYEVATEVMQKLSESVGTNYNADISTAERKSSEEFNAEMFENAVVIPCYTPAHNEKQKYCVLQIDRAKTAMSPFDDLTKANTYKEYYKKHRGIEIINTSFPLLKGKAVAKQLNFLAAKYDSWKITRQERRDAKHAGSILYLIPELMRVHPLPAPLYTQSKLLPSTLHRISRLLIASEIRASVSEFCGQTTSLFPMDLPKTHDLERELSHLNESMRKLAVAANPVTIARIDPSQVIVAKPISDLDLDGQPVGTKQDSTSVDVYSLKRKLHWVEIEYIHPRDLNWEDVEDPSDDEDDSKNTSPNISPRRSPSSVAFKTNNKLELISSEKAPCENFDVTAQQELPKQPLLTDIMEAITLSNGRDYMDLERLELIGDSVLKLLVTCHCFFHFTSFSEGQLTALRSQLISNRRLYIVGSEKNLGDLLAGSLYEPETSWLPPGKEVPKTLEKLAVDNGVNYSVFLPLEGGAEEDATIDLSLGYDQLKEIIQHRIEHLSADLQKHAPQHTSYTHSRIGDKSIADCIEALIGAYYIRGGILGALNFMAWVGLRGPVPDEKGSNDETQKQKPVFEQKIYCPIEQLPRLPDAYPVGAQTVIPQPFIDQLEQLIDYKFKNHWLIVEAFTHPSFITENAYTNAYQRLEFIGDAVLDFLVTHHIYKNAAVKSAGDLTDLRSALVNNVTFGSQAVRYGLHRLLQFTQFSSKLMEAIDLFAHHQERNDHQAIGTV